MVPPPLSRIRRIHEREAEWVPAGRREPCPGVDAASFGWSPGPLPGLRFVAPRKESLNSRLERKKQGCRHVSPARQGASVRGHERGGVCVSLDQVTRQQLQQKLTQFKPQLKQEFPELSDTDFTQAGSDPDQFISRIEQKSGQPREQVEQRVTQLVGGK